MIRLACALLVVGSVAASSWGQPFVTGFEPSEAPVWPVAPWNDSIPSTATFPVADPSGVMTFTFENWELWGGNGKNVFIGTQGARALQPEVAGQTPPAKLSVTPVVDPTDVVFKMAARTTAATGTSDWTLTLSVIEVATNTPQFVTSWTNERGNPLSASGVLGRQVAHLGVPSSTYTLEFSLTASATASNPPYVMLDDLEIFTSGDPTPPDLIPIETVSAFLAFLPAVTSMPSATRAQRQWLVDQLDRHAVEYDALYDLNVTTSTPFTDWYMARAKEIVEHLDSCEVGPGEACISKLYSSSYVVKTESCTFAADLTFGPDQDGIVPAPGIAMFIDGDTMLKLVDRLDFLIVTHYHHDHASYPVIYLMYAAGKEVYGPAAKDPNDTESLVEHFENSSYYPAICSFLPAYCDAVAKIIDPTRIQPNDVDPLLVGPNFDCELRTFAGTQTMSTLTCGGTPSTNDPTNYAYHVTTPDGLRFMFVGDHRDNLGGPCPELDSILDFTTSMNGWWPRLWSSNLTVDVKLGAGPLISAWTKRMIGFFGPLVRNHGHEWEVTHSPINRISAAWSTKPAAEEQAFPVSYGERYHFRAFPDVPHVTAVTSTSATIAFETALPVKEFDVIHRVGTAPWQTVTTTHASPSPSHSVLLNGLAPSSVHEYYVVCRTQTPGDGDPALPLIPVVLRDGPWYGSAASPSAFTTP